jgi:hypothetical protein
VLSKAISQTKSAHYPQIIEARHFFIPYAVVPFVLVIVLANWLIGWNLQETLPTSTASLIIFGLIFENPHIIASNLGLMNREYLKFYRRKLIIGVVLLIAVSLSLLIVAGERGFFTFFYTWTIYHVVRQQVGMGKLLNKQPSRLYEIWGWMYLAGSLAVAIGVGFFRDSMISVPGDIVRTSIYLISVATIAMGTIVFFRLKSRPGRYYLLANQLLLVSVVICYLQQIPLFAVLLPRMVHDISAFMIYISHDTNRNLERPKLFLYRATQTIMPIWTALLLVSVSWGAVVTYSGLKVLFWIAVSLALMHYMTEIFIWKHGSLHRRYIHIKV